MNRSLRAILIYSIYLVSIWVISFILDMKCIFNTNLTVLAQLLGLIGCAYASRVLHKNSNNRSNEHD